MDTSHMYKLLLTLLISTALGCSPGSSTVTTKTDAGVNEVPAQNACIGAATDGHCSNGDETPRPYEPLHLELVNQDGLISFDSPDHAHDHLSETDQLSYKSKDPSYWRASDQDTLKQVLMIHRHGDRTPISFAPRDELANEPFWKFHGLGQLTNRGKARLHMLGQIMRQRYDSFLAGSVNKNQRKSRASGSLRCIESAEVFLASFLSLNTGAGDNSPDAKALIWDQPDNQLAQLWQPASIQTLAAKYDGLLNEGSDCKNLYPEYALLDNTTESKNLLKEFKHEAQVINEEIGFEIDHFYKWFWAGSFLEVERSYFENKMRPALLSIYDRFQLASDRSLVLYQSTLRLRRARVGLLINDMIGNMMEMRNNSSSSLFNKKFVHYSAHDINLIFLLGIFDNIDKFPYRPDYASNMEIELHQDPNNQEWFVKLFYMARVPSKPFELHFDACEIEHPKKRCTLEKFSELMEKYRVSSWSDWMSECGNSMANIDPYNQNP